MVTGGMHIRFLFCALAMALTLFSCKKAEVEEITDEYYNVTSKLWVHFKDETKKQVFDYYINRRSFADFINDMVIPGRVPESVFKENE